MKPFFGMDNLQEREVLFRNGVMKCPCLICSNCKSYHFVIRVGVKYTAGIATCLVCGCDTQLTRGIKIE